jgi:hypothetical protein
MDNLTRYFQNLVSDLEANTAKAGWFPSAVYPDGETVAEVALKNEIGDPSNTLNGKPAPIPARPFLRNAIAENKKKWSDNLGGMIKSGMSGHNALELTAIDMAADIQQAIRNVTSPKLSKYTIDARISRIASGKAKKSGNITKPLEDTGYMLSTCIGTVEAKE